MYYLKELYIFVESPDCSEENQPLIGKSAQTGKGRRSQKITEKDN